MAKPFRERVKRFDFKPFPYELTVIVSNDIHKSRSKRSKLLGVHIADEETQAFVCGSEQLSYAWMFLPEGCDIGYITHEVNHVIYYFMKYISADFEKEFMAYYNGHYVREIAKFVYNKGKKRKKANDIRGNEGSGAVPGGQSESEIVSGVSSTGCEPCAVVEVERGSNQGNDSSAGDVVQASPTPSPNNNPRERGYGAGRQRRRSR